MHKIQLMVDFSNNSDDTRCNDFDETMDRSTLCRFQPVTFKNLSKWSRDQP